MTEDLSHKDSSGKPNGGQEGQEVLRGLHLQRCSNMIDRCDKKVVKKRKEC